MWVIVGLLVRTTCRRLIIKFDLAAKLLVEAGDKLIARHIKLAPDDRNFFPIPPKVVAEVAPCNSVDAKPLVGNFPDRLLITVRLVAYIVTIWRGFVGLRGDGIGRRNHIALIDFLAEPYLTPAGHQVIENRCFNGWFEQRFV